MSQAKAATFDFDPSLWLTNRALRACTPSARGLWLDMLCLMHAEGGYLTLNGRPLDDEKIARMVGEPIKSVRACIKELGEAGVFSVDDDGRMYSSRMVKRATFVSQARVSGLRGQKIRKAKESGSPQVAASMEKIPSQPVKVEVIKQPVAVKPQPKPKQAAWYDTPAGWVRHGQTQAMSIASGEEFTEFQVRLAARIPPGPHIECLSAMQQKMVERMRPKAPGEK